MRAGPAAVIVELPPTMASVAVELWHETGLTRPWNDPLLDLQRALDRPSSTVLAAVDGSHLVGTVMVGHDGHRGWVYYLAVVPSRQGSGLGKKLMTAAEEWVSERGIPKLQLMVRSSNAEVVGFYERLGYTDAEVVVLGRRLDGSVRPG